MITDEKLKKELLKPKCETPPLAIYKTLAMIRGGRMLLNRGQKIKLNLTPNTLKYFSQVDFMLQATVFIDGHFDGVFAYFREHYFELVDRTMSSMNHQDKLKFAENHKRDELQTLATLSRVLKEEVFNNYLEKMYSPEEQDQIRGKIRQIPARVPIDPINKHTKKDIDAK